MTKKPATRIMGILNVTPDSFSDGGHFHRFDSALEHAEHLIGAGADILDVGGESTRPYAEPVPVAEELSRVVPLIEAVRRHHAIPISIDTTKAEVARQALAAGADIVNDVSACRKDPAMSELLANTGAPLIIMHMQGTPATMQDAPAYLSVIDEICTFFAERVRFLESQGIERDRITIDPGIGFGKTLQHNLTILNQLSRFKALGLPLLLGHSRKKFIGALTGLEPQERDLATAVISGLAVQHGVDIIRVHDVAATRCALQVAEAICGSQQG